MSDPDIIAQRAGKFCIFWHEDPGSVAAIIDGFWSLEDANAFYPAMELAIARSRARHGHSLLLFDTTHAQILDHATTDRFHKEGSMFVRPGDRVAMICQSSLLKLQMKRMAEDTLDAQYFVSRSAAETWLYAHVVPPAAT